MTTPAPYCPWRRVGLPAPHDAPVPAGVRRVVGLSLAMAFPPRRSDTCDCGCGLRLPPRRKRWATAACANGAWLTTSVLAGDTDALRYVCEVKGRARQAPFVGPLPLVVRTTHLGYGCQSVRDPYPCGPVTLTRCATCRVYQHPSEWQADHIVAVALGGTHHPDNLQPLCLSCHVTKTTHDNALIRAARIRTAAPRLLADA